MTSRRILQAGAGVAAALAVVALILVLRARASGAAAEQYLLPGPLPAPDFELTAHTGQPFRMSEVGRDGLVVLFFGYTHCPDICPVTLADLGRARGLLGKDAERVTILFVTVDPERDTPSQLAEFVGRFPPGIIGLTGSFAALQKTAGDYLAFAERAPAMEGMAMDPYLFDHTARSFVVKDRRVLMTFPPQTPAKDMAAGMKLLLEG